MKKALLLSAALMLVASLAFAQAGSIGIFADQEGLSCNLTAPASGMFSFYIVHVYGTNLGGSEWAATKPACMSNAMWLSDTNRFPVVIGNTQGGYSVGYGQCFSAPVYICTMNFFAMGPTAACCLYSVTAHPNNANHRIEGSDCDLNLTLPTGGQGRVNSNVSCNCTTPVQDSTWGSVKALFE